IETTTYEVNGEKVTRFAPKENGKIIGHLDVMQKGGTVLMEAGPGEARHIGKLQSAAAEGAGPESGAFSASVNVGALFDQVGKLPNSPLAQLPPELKKQIADML